MKWGLVGFGSWGKVLSSAISENYKLKAVSSRNIARVRSDIREKNLNFEANTNEQIIEDPEIKIVAVTVPIESLFFYAKEAMSKGKHVFLEKPGPKTEEQLSLLREVAKRNNIVCYINYIYYEDSALQFLVDKIEKKAVKNISITWNKWGSFNNDIVDNLVTHQISILMKVAKDPIILTDVQVDKNRFFASFRIRDIDTSIKVNRVSKVNNGLQMKIITQDSIYSWSPGKVMCMEKDIFIDDSDMLVNQTKRMNDLIENMSIDSNFSLVEKINRLIFDIRSFSK